MRRPAVSILVPVYNEAPALRRMLAALRALRLDAEVVAVDDGSTDGSGRMLRRIARRWRALRVLVHPENRGKGAAVATAVAAARGRIAVLQDADLETDPRDVPRLLSALARAGRGGGRPAAAFGTRFPRHVRPARVPRLTWLVNRLLTGAVNLLFGARLTDMACAYKALPLARLRGLRLTARRFELEAELTAALLRRGDRIVEVPVRYRPRTYAEGKKIHPFDGLRILAALLRARLQ